MNHAGNTWRPPTDVYETSDAVIVRVEIAGVQESDLNIELVRRTLVVNGRRLDQLNTDKLAYHQMEVPFGEFRTDAYLPLPVDQTGIEATYQDGFLIVKLPKARATRIPVVDLSGAEESALEE